MYSTHTRTLSFAQLKYLEKRKVTGLFLKRKRESVCVCVRVPGVLGVVVQIYMSTDVRERAMTMKFAFLS